MSFYEKTPAVDYFETTLKRISTALGYDEEINHQKCWDWIETLRQRWGNDDLDERINFCLKYYENTNGYLPQSENHRKGG